MDWHSILDMLIKFFPVLGAIGTSAAILAVTLAVVETIKEWPIFIKVKTQILSIVIGTALTAFAFFTGQLSSSVWIVAIQVIMGCLGASGVWDLFKRKAA